MKAIWTRPISKPSQTAFPCVDPKHDALEGIKLMNSNALCLPLRSLFWGDLYRYSGSIRWVLKMLEATSGIVPFLFAQFQQVQLFYNS